MNKAPLSESSKQKLYEEWRGDIIEMFSKKVDIALILFDTNRTAIIYSHSPINIMIRYHIIYSIINFCRENKIPLYTLNRILVDITGKINLAYDINRHLIKNKYLTSDALEIIPISWDMINGDFTYDSGVFKDRYKITKWTYQNIPGVDFMTVRLPQFIANEYREK